MDQKSYQKMFDQVRMPAQRAEQIRSELAARCAQEEVIMDNSKKSRRPMAAVIAVCAVAVLTVTAFASGGRMFERVFQMMTVPDASASIGEDGSFSVDGMEAEEPVSPVELREDGRLYLTINGENRDITEECSYETPYVYECTGEDGLIHTFIIGGEPDNVGWVEYACDSDSDVAVSASVFSVGDDVELTALPWLTKGLEQTMGGKIELSLSAEEDWQEITVYDFDGNTVTGVETHTEVVTLTEN